MESFLKSIQLSGTFGIASIAQLECFLVIAMNEGRSVEAIVGRDPTHKKYRQFMGQARKLMVAGYRGSDGLRLIRLVGRPKESRLGLTAKGKRLFSLVAMEVK
jgi:hypothetical protein